MDAPYWPLGKNGCGSSDSTCSANSTNPHPDADLHYGIGSITFAADFIESQSAGSNQQSRAANCQSALNGGDGYYVTAWSSRGAGRDGLDRGVHSVASEDNTFERKTVHRPTEVELSAQTWPGVYMKRMRHIDYPTFGSRTPPVPSSHGSNGRSPPLRKAERDEVDNMGQRRSELHVEQRYSSVCPPESDKRNWGWISPPFTPETENVALHRSRGRDRGPDHGRRGKGPFRLPMASSSGSDVFATDMHDVQYRGTYPRSRQPPTYETWTAYGGDSQLDEVAVDSVQRVGRRGSPSSDLDPLHLPLREDRARFVKLVSECRKRRPGDWSKSEEGSTAGGKYKNWPRTFPTAMTTDARHERGGASSVNYGRNSDSRVWGTRNEDFHLPDTLPARSRYECLGRNYGHMLTLSDLSESMGAATCHRKIPNTLFSKNEQYSHHMDLRSRCIYRLILITPPRFIFVPCKVASKLIT